MTPDQLKEAYNLLLPRAKFMKWKVIAKSGEMHMFDTTEEMVAFVKDHPGCVIQTVR